MVTNLLELLKYKKSIIVTDAKGEIYRKTNTLFRENNYIVKVFNLKDMAHSDRWNPLGENEDITDIQTSSNVIITGTQKHNATDIDLTLPGKRPCIYYVVSSDVDSSRDFLISLFFTFLFIKLVKYADSRIDGKCENDVFFFLDEFANIGEIPDFNKKISTVRSRGIALIPIVQNIRTD